MGFPEYYAYAAILLLHLTFVASLKYNTKRLFGKFHHYNQHVTQQTYS